MPFWAPPSGPRSTHAGVGWRWAFNLVVNLASSLGIFCLAGESVKKKVGR